MTLARPRERTSLFALLMLARLGFELSRGFALWLFCVLLQGPAIRLRSTQRNQRKSL